jgi:hypothetical protein
MLLRYIAVAGKSVLDGFEDYFGVSTHFLPPSPSTAPKKDNPSTTSTFTLMLLLPTPLQVFTECHNMYRALIYTI